MAEEKSLDAILAERRIAWDLEWAGRGLVRRKDEVRKVLEALSKRRMRNVILVGPAGCGKTELAREACMRE